MYDGNETKKIKKYCRKLSSPHYLLFNSNPPVNKKAVDFCQNFLFSVVALATQVHVVVIKIKPCDGRIIRSFGLN